MRAMSAWPASAAMSAAVLLSLHCKERLGVDRAGGWGWVDGRRVEEGACGRWRGGGGVGTHEALVATSAPATSSNSKVSA